MAHKYTSAHPETQPVDTPVTMPQLLQGRGSGFGLSVQRREELSLPEAPGWGLPASPFEKQNWWDPPAEPVVAEPIVTQPMAGPTILQRLAERSKLEGQKQADLGPEFDWQQQIQAPIRRIAEVGAAGGDVSADLEQRIQRSRSQGQEIAAPMREKYEQAFRRDFGRVRIHANTESDQLNRAVQAKAFTTGNDIYFKQGEYRPESPSGQELLAHELTHVVQQTGQDSLQRSAPGLFLQRQETEEAESLDPDLEGLLDQLGFSTPEVPPMSAIVAATGADLSSGTLESEIERLWRRERLPFTAAAREAAARDVPAQHADEAHAVASPDVAPTEGYGLRWAVSFYAYDYQHSTDLGEIRLLLRRGSPFQESLDADTDHVIPVENPTADVFHSQIRDAVLAMSLALPEGTVGEMIVHFSGHGGDGGILAVDGNHVSRQELLAIAAYAADFSVHITYVIDACLAGSLVQHAEATAAESLLPRLQQLSGAARAEARQRFNAYAILQNHGTWLSQASTDLTYAARAVRRPRATSEHRESYDTAITTLRTRLQNLGEALQELSLDTVPGYMAISVQQAAALAIFSQDAFSNPQATLSMMRFMGQLLDQLNESCLALYEQLQAMLTDTDSTSTSSETAVPEDSEREDTPVESSTVPPQATEESSAIAPQQTEPDTQADSSLESPQGTETPSPDPPEPESQSSGSASAPQSAEGSSSVTEPAGPDSQSASSTTPSQSAEASPSDSSSGVASSRSRRRRPPGRRESAESTPESAQESGGLQLTARDGVWLVFNRSTFRDQVVDYLWGDAFTPTITELHPRQDYTAHTPDGLELIRGTTHWALAQTSFAARSELYQRMRPRVRQHIEQLQDIALERPIPAPSWIPQEVWSEFLDEEDGIHRYSAASPLGTDIILIKRDGIPFGGYAEAVTDETRLFRLMQVRAPSALERLAGLETGRQALVRWSAEANREYNEFMLRQVETGIGPRQARRNYIEANRQRLLRGYIALIGGSTTPHAAGGTLGDILRATGVIPDYETL